MTGQGHDLAPPDPAREAGRAPDPGAEARDIPDWLWPSFADSLGARASDVAEALRSRAPVHLRANLARTTREAAEARLRVDGIETVPHAAADSTLEIVSGARKLRQSQAYSEGLVELQDAASQAVVAALPLRNGLRVLDYCAGGGGKALAMAARAEVDVFAHDIAPERMRDLPDRAARAGARVTLLSPGTVHGRFDLVLCDAPCSGSGAWRRDPDGKWRLTRARLDALTRIQIDILHHAADLVTEGGTLAYATCSVLAEENDAQIEGFLGVAPGWVCTRRDRWLPDEGTDGFFLAQLTRA
jgi:16S rRNA (cytosine967-C5)-methyltransferase